MTPKRDNPLHFGGFFANLAKRRLKCGVFRSIIGVHAAINKCFAETNHAPRRITWTADPCRMIAAVRRGRQVLASIQ